MFLEKHRQFFSVKYTINSEKLLLPFPLKIIISEICWRKAIFTYKDTKIRNS